MLYTIDIKWCCEGIVVREEVQIMRCLNDHGVADDGL